MEPNTIQGLGKLSAFIVNDKSKIILRVAAEFPFNGEKPRYTLEKDEHNSPDKDPKKLILTLSPGGPVREGAPLTLRMTYSEELTSREQYTSVVITDGGRRVLASGNIE